MSCPRLLCCGLGPQHELCSHDKALQRLAGDLTSPLVAMGTSPDPHTSKQKSGRPQWKGSALINVYPVQAYVLVRSYAMALVQQSNSELN